MSQVQTTPAASFNAYLQKYKNQLANALPKHMSADRMTRLALTAFSQNKALAACDPKSIFASLIVASQLGLEPGVNGQCYLIPYGRNCTLVPGWQGLADLVSRSGRASVWTGAVYEGDEFDFMLGDSPYCKHKPGGEFELDKLTHVYAIGRIKDSVVPVIEVWPVKKVDAHLKKYNKVGGKHYALTENKRSFEMYARKVALLQVLKYMPKSIELSAAVETAHASEQGHSVTIDGDFVVVDQSEETSQQESGATSNESLAPTFEQLKTGILGCKALLHLESIEEKALEHDDTPERAELIKMVKAKRLQLTQHAEPVKADPAPATTQADADDGFGSMD